MVEVLVLEKHASLYAAAIAERFPGLRVHAATNVEAALSCCRDAEVIVALAHEIPDALVQRMPRLAWVQALTTGVDHLLALPSLHASVRITNGRGIHGPQMSEMAFLYMIALSRNLRAMLANQARAHWERWPQPVLLGKTAVLVGVGAISEAMAARCQAFGMRVIGVSDSRASAPGFDVILPRAALHAAASQADFLIVLVPLDRATEHMIDAGVLAAMKPSAILINLARGPVIDEAALIVALQEGRIAGAGLDVFAVEPPAADNPLWQMDNVIMTPRVGGMSDIYAQQITPLLLDNLAAYAAGKPEEMRNVVTR